MFTAVHRGNMISPKTLCLLQWNEDSDVADTKIVNTCETTFYKDGEGADLLNGPVY